MLLSIPWLAPATATATMAQPQPKRPLTDQLTHYSAGATALPPSARVMPDKKQQLATPISLTDLWRYGAFIAYKGTVPAVGFL